MSFVAMFKVTLNVVLKNVFQTFESRAEYKSKEVENDQNLCSSLNTSEDRRMQIDWQEGIYNPIRLGNTIPVRYFNSEKKHRNMYVKLDVTCVFQGIQ